MRLPILLTIALALFAGGFAPHDAIGPSCAWGQDFGDTWAMDRLKLKDGRTLAGLVEFPNGRSSRWLELTEIRRYPGRPTGLIVKPIVQADVAQAVLLEPAAREQLRQRIGRIRGRAKIEARELDAISLSEGTITITGSAEPQKLKALRYNGPRFSLLTTTDETTARRLAVHIEQLFGAFRQMIPPRLTTDQPVRFLVFSSPLTGRQYLASRGGPADPDIIFPDGFACYLENQAEVIVALGWARYDGQRRALDREIAGLEAEIKVIEDTRRARLENLNRQLEGASPAQRAQIKRQAQLETVRLDKKIKECRRNVSTYRRKTETMLDEFLKQLLAALNHEAWHAYSRAYVFPPDRFDIPPWLDEGLAMTFESGVLEQGMLRIDTPSRAMLDVLADAPPVPLAKLLTAPRSSFQENDRVAVHYATAWSVVYLLAIEKGILTSRTISSLVPAKSTTPKVTQSRRLESLTGIPLNRLDTYLPTFIEGLQGD